MSSTKHPQLEGPTAEVIDRLIEEYGERGATITDPSGPQTPEIEADRLHAMQTLEAFVNSKNLPTFLEAAGARTHMSGERLTILAAVFQLGWDAACETIFDTKANVN